VHVTDEQARHVFGTCAIVEEDDLLSRAIGPRQHVTHFESDAEAGSRRFRDERVARRQPIEVAPEHGFLGELRLRSVHVVLEQVRGDDLVTVMSEPFADRATGCDPTAMGDPAAWLNPPQPFPSRIVRSPEPLFATAMSSRPSRFTSPSSAECGSVPTASGDPEAWLNPPKPFPSRIVTVSSS